MYVFYLQTTIKNFRKQNVTRFEDYFRIGTLNKKPFKSICPQFLGLLSLLFQLKYVLLCCNCNPKYSRPSLFVMIIILRGHDDKNMIMLVFWHFYTVLCDFVYPQIIVPGVWCSTTRVLQSPKYEGWQLPHSSWYPELPGRLGPRFGRWCARGCLFFGC